MKTSFKINGKPIPRATKNLYSTEEILNMLLEALDGVDFKEQILLEQLSILCQDCGKGTAKCIKHMETVNKHL